MNDKVKEFLERVRLTDIEGIYEAFERVQFEHPDVDKPDFVLFDPVKFGEVVAQAVTNRFLDDPDLALIDRGKKMNGNLVNNLYDAMAVIEMSKCRLLVKRALDKAGYLPVIPLRNAIKEVKDD